MGCTANIKMSPSPSWHVLRQQAPFQLARHRQYFSIAQPPASTIASKKIVRHNGPVKCLLDRGHKRFRDPLQLNRYLAHHRRRELLTRLVLQVQVEQNDGAKQQLVELALGRDDYWAPTGQ